MIENSIKMELFQVNSFGPRISMLFSCTRITIDSTFFPVGIILHSNVLLKSKLIPGEWIWINQPELLHANIEFIIVVLKIIAQH